VPGTARRHCIAELTTYIVVVGTGLPSVFVKGTLNTVACR